MRHVLTACLLAGLLPSTANAVVLIDNELFTASDSVAAPPGSTPALAGPGGLVGGLIGGPISFTAPYGGTLAITVEDCCRVGDVFEVILDGISLGITMPVPIDGPDNSRGTFVANIAGGLHTIGIWDFVLSYATSPFGGEVPPGFGPSDLTVSAVLPEPASFALLGLGLFGLGLLRRAVPRT